MPALAIRQDLPPSELRRLARFELDRRASMRLLAVANALEGMSRAEAARLAGMERQALRDAVIRYNAEGPEGLHDRPRSGRPEGLNEGQQAALKAWVLRGPDPERDGVSAWRLIDICDHAERVSACATARGACRGCSSGWGSRIRRRGPGIHKVARPRRPRSKKELGAQLTAIAATHPQAEIQLWCEDEARIGQKGRLCHRWYEHGVRPPGIADQRYDSVYLFAACRPGTDEAFALALPRATTEAMAVFLAAFAQQLETGVHAVLLLDQAGWHCTPKLAVPDNVTLLPLPACSPELNPVERVWLYLRERFLSHRVHRDYAAVLDAACAAWNRLVQETGRLASLTGYPYLMRSEFR